MNEFFKNAFIKTSINATLFRWQCIKSKGNNNQLETKIIDIYDFKKKF